MRTTILIVLISLVIGMNKTMAQGSLHVQDSSISNNKYISWVMLKKNKEPLKKRYKGTLYELKHSSILIADPIKQNNSVINHQIVEIEIEDITLIQTRKKDSVVKGLLIGAGISALLIGFTAIADSQSSSSGVCGDCGRTIGWPAIGILGVSLGAAFGTYRKTYTINGSIPTYNHYKDNLKDYTVVK